MTQRKTESQSLVASEKVLVGELILEARDLPTKFDELRSRANLITPVVEITSIAPHHAVNLSVVYIDPTVDENGNGPMCYRDKTFMGQDERGLNKIALDMVAAAAGISWLPHPHSRRTDDGKTPHVWAFTVVGAYTAMDGTIQTLPPGSVEVDLRDGSDQIGGWTQEEWEKLVESNKGKPKTAQKWTLNGWSDKRVRQARRFGLQLAETKARLRAIRSLGIKQKFTVEELRKPFVVPRVSFQPDMNNPVVAEIVTRQKLAGVSALFSQQQALPPATDVASVAASTPVHDEQGDADGPPPEVGGGANTAVATQAAEQSAGKDESFGDEPQEFVEFLVIDAGKRAAGGFYIAVANPREPQKELYRLLTDDESAARAAHASKVAGKPIYVDVESRKVGDMFKTFVLELRTEKPNATDEGL